MHIAIIPDGNRRWAKKQGLASFLGHQAGAKAIEDILRPILDHKISFTTIWGCSVSNLTNRESSEVSFLLNLFEEMFNKLAESPEIHQNKVKITALGRWHDHFTPGARQAVENMIQKTKEYSAFHLTFMLGYSGTEEMTSTINKLITEGKPVTEVDIKSTLYTSELPPVDLVIRTGGEPHLSTGFMMWDTAEARLYFTETLWPDFSPAELQKALTFFDTTERRGGR